MNGSCDGYWLELGCGGACGVHLIYYMVSVREMDRIFNQVWSGDGVYLPSAMESAIRSIGTLILT